MTKVQGELSHLCIKGVPVYGDPCLKCQEIAAQRVETALDPPPDYYDFRPTEQYKDRYKRWWGCVHGALLNQPSHIGKTFCGRFTDQVRTTVHNDHAHVNCKSCHLTQAFHAAVVEKSLESP